MTSSPQRVEVFTGQSRVTVAGADVPASDLEVRVSQLLPELNATDVPEGNLVTLLEGVLFDFDSAALKPDASGVLDRVAEVVVLAEGRRASIRGHTDSRGADEYNQDLSNRRAPPCATTSCSAMPSTLHGSRQSASARPNPSSPMRTRTARTIRAGAKPIVG